MTLVTKGLYVGALGMSGLLSNFGLVIHISQRVDITRYQDKQRALHVVCGQRCRQDEALDNFARDDDLSKVIERDGGHRCRQDKRAMISVRDERPSNFKFRISWSRWLHSHRSEPRARDCRVSFAGHTSSPRILAGAPLATYVSSGESAVQSIHGTSMHGWDA